MSNRGQTDVKRMSGGLTETRRSQMDVKEVNGVNECQTEVKRGQRRSNHGQTEVNKWRSGEVEWNQLISNGCQAESQRNVVKWRSNGCQMNVKRIHSGQTLCQT